MTECFTPYDDREVSVPCSTCGEPAGVTCKTPVGYAHPSRMEDGLRARKGAA